MRHLVLLATGGTVATRSRSGGRRVEAGAADLLHAAERVWDLGDLRVEPRDAQSIVSFAATVPDVLTLADTVRQASSDGAEGIVITHGTDTLEETAFLLALAHEGQTPVVLTGAQRPFDDPATDGPRNVAAALRWAAAPEAAGTGVTVVFADQVLPAVGVRKVRSLELAAFAAPGRGPIGHVDELGVRAHAVSPMAPFLPPGLTDLPRVDVIAQYLGADAGAVEAAASLGARGLVLAGFGAGNATPATTRACLRLLADGMPVLVTSRTGEGPVAGLYAEGGAALAEAGAVMAGDLSPWQARLLLAATLAVESEPDRVRTHCLRWLRGVGAAAG
ncbi:L-asparaginase [Prauserella marina]|uniref:asparaginase n=1 Tax=Prauserella marina TaxID=530584 RepID=A0A222VNP8_9PSEU|nr:asparaginase domain-containing protein [Prauserella marina]ASR35540.1 L-asparaginase [Prauserella marina]PWV84620.1 L-asparaginase [Prauserella marina]SDC17497.1 L-asparaginase [Prauserella marina]